MNEKVILFILEGEKREVSLFKNLSSIFFKGKAKIVPICIPAKMNIYMLYQLMKNDNFDTDVVELLKENIDEADKELSFYKRDQIAEIYYFFDFDEHANNTKGIKNVDALKEMLDYLNNETENGKLYISYPMIEAIRDFIPKDCRTISNSCYRGREDFGKYKQDSSLCPANNNFNGFEYPDWLNIIAPFISRALCLFGSKNLDRAGFIELVTPITIFEKELIIQHENEKIFILSCIPEFLIDYSENCWNSTIKKRKIMAQKNCERVS